MTNHGNVVSLEYVKPHPAGWYVHARATTDLLKVIGEGYPHPNYTLTAYAVCTDLPSGYEVVAVGSPELDERMYGEAVTCPQGKKVYSAGLGKYNPLGAAHVTGVFPTSDRTGVWTSAHGVDVNYGWYLSAFAICADG